MPLWTSLCKYLFEFLLPDVCLGIFICVLPQARPAPWGLVFLKFPARCGESQRVSQSLSRGAWEATWGSFRGLGGRRCPVIVRADRGGFMEVNSQPHPEGRHPLPDGGSGKGLTEANGPAQRRAAWVTRRPEGANGLVKGFGMHEDSG